MSSKKYCSSKLFRYIPVERLLTNPLDSFNQIINVPCLKIICIIKRYKEFLVFELQDKFNMMGGEDEGKRKEKTMTKKFDSLLQILKQNFSHTKCMLNWSKIVVFRKILTRLMTNHCMVHGFSALCHITYISLLCRQLCVLRWNRFVFGGERVHSDRLLQHGTIHTVRRPAGDFLLSSLQFYSILLSI